MNASPSVAPSRDAEPAQPRRSGRGALHDHSAARASRPGASASSVAHTRLDRARRARIAHVDLHGGCAASTKRGCGRRGRDSDVRIDLQRHDPPRDQSRRASRRPRRRRRAARPRAPPDGRRGAEQRVLVRGMGGDGPGRRRRRLGFGDERRSLVDARPDGVRRDCGHRRLDRPARREPPDPPRLPPLDEGRPLPARPHRREHRQRGGRRRLPARDGLGCPADRVRRVRHDCGQPPASARGDRQRVQPRRPTHSTDGSRSAGHVRGHRARRSRCRVRLRARHDRAGGAGGAHDVLRGVLDGGRRARRARRGRRPPVLARSVEHARRPDSRYAHDVRVRRRGRRRRVRTGDRHGTARDPEGRGGAAADQREHRALPAEPGRRGPVGGHAGRDDDDRAGRDVHAPGRLEPSTGGRGCRRTTVRSTSISSQM